MLCRIKRTVKQETFLCPEQTGQVLNTEEKQQGVMVGWKTLTVPRKISGKYNLEH